MIQAAYPEKPLVELCAHVSGFQIRVELRLFESFTDAVKSIYLWVCVINYSDLNG